MIVQSSMSTEQPTNVAYSGYSSTEILYYRDRPEGEIMIIRDEDHYKALVDRGYDWIHFYPSDLPEDWDEEDSKDSEPFDQESVDGGQAPVRSLKRKITFQMEGDSPRAKTPVLDAREALSSKPAAQKPSLGNKAPAKPLRKRITFQVEGDTRSAKPNQARVLDARELLERKRGAQKAAVEDQPPLKSQRKRITFNDSQVRDDSRGAVPNNKAAMATNKSKKPVNSGFRQWVRKDGCKNRP